MFSLFCVNYLSAKCVPCATLVVHILVLMSSLIVENNGEESLFNSECECGIRNHNSVTVLTRGKFSENHAWPWMVSIVNTTLPNEPAAYCGATLINDRYVLTAAHCIPDMMDTGIENFRIYVGTNYIANGTDFLDLGILKILSHPKFDFDTADNDICLIKLSQSVEFSNEVSPICLRQDGVPFVGENGYVTGWGSYNLSEPTEDSLKEASAVIVSNEICSKNYSAEDIPITGNMICASLDNEADPCKGDSGGPLMVKDNDKDAFTQIGIISHGQGCAVPGYPAIFSSISPYIDWIKSNTKDGLYCSGTFSS